MSEMRLLLLILLPLAGGACFFFAPFLRGKKARTIFLCSVLAGEVLLTLSAVLSTAAASIGMEVTEGIRFGLAVDDLSRLFLVLFSVMWLLAGIYSLEYMEHEQKIERFYGFYLMTLASLMGIAMSKNMVTLYLFYEFMTLLSLPMVLHSQTPEAKKAGLKYLFYSIAGALLALGGLVFVYYGGGVSLEFVAGGAYPAGAPNVPASASQERSILIGSFLMLIGFGTKAGMFPMQSWLPTAHPVAPAPASAVLSGVITKTGVFAVIRLLLYMVGIEALAGTWVQYAWLTLALITIFLGSMLAYKEKLLKKRLAFSTVSQVSYIMFGLATMTPYGILGALLHVVFHSIVKNTLFFSAGSIIHHTGKTRVDELTGIGKEMPVTLWCFALTSITLVGIPPTSAFVSKWYLAQGALSASSLPGIFRYGGPVILLLSALLTAGYLVVIVMRGFLPGEDFDYDTLKKKEAGARMLVPMLLLTGAAVVLGMYMTPLLTFLQKIV